MGVDSVDQVVSLLDLIDQLKDLGRMGLHVIVHTQDVIPFCIGQGRHQRIVLSEVAQKIDPFYILPLLGQAADHTESPVPRVIVDQDELAGIAWIFVKFLGHKVDDFPDGRLGIVARYDHGY